MNAGGGGTASIFLMIHPLLNSAPLPPLLPLHPPVPSLHELVAGARRLVVLYCVLRGPVHGHGPDQAAAADLEEIDQVSDATVATREQRKNNNYYSSIGFFPWA